MFCRPLGSVTFEQQRHEGDVRRTEFGHSQPISPVVAWRILQRVEKEQEEHHYLNVFGKYITLHRNRAKHDLLPSTSRRHSRFFLSCWGFSGTVICKKGKTTFTTIVNLWIRGYSHLPGLVKPVHCAVAQTKHDSKEWIEIFLLLQSVKGRTWSYTWKGWHEVLAMLV